MAPELILTIDQRKFVAVHGALTAEDSRRGFVMSTKKSMLAAAVMAIGLALGVQAHADTYNFSYSDSAISVSGTLTTGSADTGLNGPGFDITGITGTVTDTSGTFNINNVPLLLGACCDSPANNNIFYVSGTPYLDLAGLGFSDSHGEWINLYYQNAGPTPGYQAFVSLDQNVTTTGSGPGALTIAPVPLPGTLPLFATSLGALGLLGWRRKKKAPTSVA